MEKVPAVGNFDQILGSDRAKTYPALSLLFLYFMIGQANLAILILNDDILALNSWKVCFDLIRTERTTVINPRLILHNFGGYIRSF